MKNNNFFLNKLIDKEPYIKYFTDDKVINITGRSGSGKTYTCKNNYNNEQYIVIDTDLIFNHYETDNLECIELREVFKNESREILTKDFDRVYLKILDTFKDRGKIIVIDSACFINMKDYSILKECFIALRTSVYNSYINVLERWKNNNKDFGIDEYINYVKKKQYLLNSSSCFDLFLERINKL